MIFQRGGGAKAPPLVYGPIFQSLKIFQRRIGIQKILNGPVLILSFYIRHIEDKLIFGNAQALLLRLF